MARHIRLSGSLCGNCLWRDCHRITNHMWRDTLTLFSCSGAATPERLGFDGSVAGAGMPTARCGLMTDLLYPVQAHAVNVVWCRHRTPTLMLIHTCQSHHFLCQRTHSSIKCRSVSPEHPVCFIRHNHFSASCSHNYPRCWLPPGLLNAPALLPPWES